MFDEVEIDYDRMNKLLKEAIKIWSSKGCARRARRLPRV